MALSRAGGWTIAVLVLLAAPTAWAISRVLTDDAGPFVLEGVRLGMTPADVRRSFSLAGAGRFQSEAMGEDFALAWAPMSPSGLVSARFEFHESLLVAVRLRGRAGAETVEALDGPSFEQTPGSVLARRSGSDLTDVIWLSRDCPTHANEVARLVASR